MAYEIVASDETGSGRWFGGASDEIGAISIAQGMLAQWAADIGVATGAEVLATQVDVAGGLANLNPALFGYSAVLWTEV